MTVKTLLDHLDNSSTIHGIEFYFNERRAENCVTWNLVDFRYGYYGEFRNKRVKSFMVEQERVIIIVEA